MNVLKAILDKEYNNFSNDIANVEVTYTNNKKTKLAQVHNVGGNPLFNFLTDCLIGDFDVAKASRPTKIKLLKYSTDTNNPENSISGYSFESASDFIYLQTKPEKVYASSNGAVVYSFIISRTMLEKTDFNGIGLYTDSATAEDLNNFAAFCPITVSKSSLSASAVLVVDWELIISNNNFKEA